MRVSDLLRAGGFLSEEAYTLRAELARYQVVNDEYRSSEVIDIDLDAVLRGDTSADLLLAEHDNLRISALPQWDMLWSVFLEGEVQFPGEYRIRRGETLRQVLERAGGLTEAAFPEGAIFLRESLREREQEQNRDGCPGFVDEDGDGVCDNCGDHEANGTAERKRFIAARYPGSNLAGNVELRDGDRLLVPKQAQEVTVIGETQQNTSHLYQPGITRDDYIEMSGGLTRRADKKLIYVVRASGAVVTGNRSKWFGRQASAEIRPGDTIVVPLETDRIRPLTFWTNVTQIIYQGAIAVAAIASFDN